MTLLWVDGWILWIWILVLAGWSGRGLLGGGGGGKGGRFGAVGGCLPGLEWRGGSVVGKGDVPTRAKANGNAWDVGAAGCCGAAAAGACCWGRGLGLPC